MNLLVNTLGGWMEKHISVGLKLHPLSLQDSVCTRIKQELQRKRKKEVSDRETTNIESEKIAKQREKKLGCEK